MDPRLVAVAGAITIGLSAVLVAAAGTSSSTATFFRCLFALPILLMLTRAHAGSDPGGNGLSASGWHALAGLFLGVDMLLWAESISAVGAGIASVLVNVQAVVVPLVTLLLFGEQVHRWFWWLTPLLLAGVGLAGGVGTPATHSSAAYGTATGVLAGVAYAGFLIILRHSGPPSQGPAMLATVTATAGIVALIAGTLSKTLDFAPTGVSLGWLLLLAASGQVLGWILVGSALSRLPTAVGATLLTLQPIVALVSGAIFLGERPNIIQLAGCALVLTVVGLVARLGAAPRPSGGGGHTTLALADRP